MKSKQSISRRNFLNLTSTTAAAIAVSPRFAFAAPFTSTRKVRVGVVGGRFGLGFYFNEHPNVTVEAVSDLRADRRAALMKRYECDKSYESLEILLKDPKIEAVGLFTPAPDHAVPLLNSREPVWLLKRIKPAELAGCCAVLPTGN